MVKAKNTYSSSNWVSVQRVTLKTFYKKNIYKYKMVYFIIIWFIPRI